MAYNKPTLKQIAVNASATLATVINPSGAWIGSPTGLQGATGVQGTTGATGVQGTTGTTGVQGVQGVQGRQGTTGGFTTGSNAQVNSLGINTAASGTAGEIRATGEITAFYSDDRLKNRIGNIPEALRKVLSLNGFFFEPNETAQQLGYERKIHVGVSAQEVESILPEIVVPAPIDGAYKTVHYERLIPLLIEAIKELNSEDRATIVHLKERVAHLERLLGVR